MAASGSKSKNSSQANLSEPYDGPGADLRFEQEAAAELVPPDNDTEAGNESSKLRQLMSVLRKTMNVKDLANLRLSLPANLLHPEGNLEYWHYLDRPDLFACIGDNDDGFERMLAVLRWLFTKDLKQVKGGVCKPYNSVLGEQFRALWDVVPASIHPETQKPVFFHSLDESNTSKSASVDNPSSSASSIRSMKSTGTADSTRIGPLSRSATATSSVSSLADSMADSHLTTIPGASSTPGTSLGSTTGQQDVASTVLRKDGRRARVVFLNEQVSHHPPISSFWYESQPPDTGGQRVISYGVDQLSAKFTGTSVKVYAGSENHGIYVLLPDRNNEEYNITHPTAFITGLLRGCPYVTISEHSYVTCLSPNGQSKPGTKALRAIINFIDESWIGRARFALEGVVYEYTIGTEDAEYTKVKQVPESKIKAWIEGSWRGKISYKTKKTAKPSVLIDVGEILPVPKMVRPIETQDEMESRRLWQPVTTHLLSKQYGRATKHKQAIEQRQRDRAAERERAGAEHEIILFDDRARLENQGRPRLSAQGQQVLKQELAGHGYRVDDIPPGLQ